MIHWDSFPWGHCPQLAWSRGFDFWGAGIKAFFDARSEGNLFAVWRDVEAADCWLRLSGFGRFLGKDFGEGWHN
jgi:hypothetical protein